MFGFTQDMVHVSKCKGKLIEPGPKEAVDSINAHKPSIIAPRGTLYHFYCAVSHKYGRGISVASSCPWMKAR